MKTTTIDYIDKQSREKKTRLIFTFILIIPIVIIVIPPINAIKSPVAVYTTHIFKFVAQLMTNP